MAPQQGGPHPAGVSVHDLHPAQDRPHQWQPVGGDGGGARQHQVLAVLPVRRLEQQLVALHPRSLLPGRTGRVDTSGDTQPVVAEVRARARGAVEPGLVPHQRAQGPAVGQGQGGDRGGHPPMLPAAPRRSPGALAFLWKQGPAAPLWTPASWITSTESSKTTRLRVDFEDFVEVCAAAPGPVSPRSAGRPARACGSG